VNCPACGKSVVRSCIGCDALTYAECTGSHGECLADLNEIKDGFCRRPECEKQRAMRARAEEAQSLAGECSLAPWRDEVGFLYEAQGVYIGEFDYLPDGRFIAASRTLVPALASDVLALLKRVEELERGGLDYRVRKVED
jgi:hypothetical protein